MRMPITRATFGSSRCHSSGMVILYRKELMCSEALLEMVRGKEERSIGRGMDVICGALIAI